MSELSTFEGSSKPRNFFWSALEANFAICGMDEGTYSWDDEEEVFAGFTVEVA